MTQLATQGLQICSHLAQVDVSAPWAQAVATYDYLLL